jgi:hypothetical protein
MASVTAIFVVVLSAYVTAGIVVALAFVIRGLSEVLPAGTPVTIGARILILPGAAALWPVVVRRWLQLRDRP